MIPPHGDFLPVGAPVKGYPGPTPGEGLRSKGHKHPVVAWATLGGSGELP